MVSNQLELTAGFLVTGRVQGVGFRWWTRRVACRLGLSGTVRNLSNGCVEVRARGSAAALAELERSLRIGPLAAAVDAVESVPVVGFVPEGFHLLA